jgi:hypothetical protein
MMDNTEFQRALFERKGVPVPITLRAEARRNEARRTEARKTDVK